MNPLQNGYDPKNLQLIFYTLLLAQLGFLVVVVYMLSDADFVYRLNQLNYTLIPVVALALDFYGNRYFTNGLAKATQDRELENALATLTNIHIVRWILVEGATTLLLACSLYYNNHFFTAFAAANTFYFSTLRPKLFTFNQQF